MKKQLLIVAIIAGSCLTLKAQTTIADTSLCTLISKIQRQAVLLISQSNISVDKADNARQDLLNVAIFFDNRKKQLIEEDKKKLQPKK